MVIFAGSCLLVPAVQQAAEIERSDLPQEPRENETKAETIARCLKDLQSDEPSTRRQAVLILGKYHSAPKAQQGVMASLDDPEAEVRQAALVALGERGLIPPQAAALVLDMLDDENVHVRRIASSQLPKVMRGYRIRRRSPRGDRENGSRFDDDLRTSIREAFRDEDDAVRTNMLSNYEYFRHLITPELLEPLLGEEKENIQLLALKAARNSLTSQEFLQAVGPLVDDKDKKVRLYIARNIPMAQSETTVDILRRLSRDSVADIAVLAITKLLRLNELEDVSTLKKLLKEPSLDSAIGVKAIRVLGLSGASGVKLLEHLLESGRSRFRATAMRMLGRIQPEKLTIEELSAYLSDPSKKVREVAIRLLRRKEGFNRRQLKDLAGAEHAEVRRFAVNATGSLSEKKAVSLLLKFLPDDNPNVRAAVIRQFAERQLQGWQDILRRSLNEESETVRHTAIKVLLENRNEETSEILKRHMRKSESNELRKAIKRYLQQKRQRNNKTKRIPLGTDR